MLFFIRGHFVNRGFLFGPLCPIYGYGAIILICIFKKYKLNNFKLFLSSAIVFSIFEYLVGFAMEAIFSARWWDYSSDFMNLNGRISIFYTLAWGIIAIIFIKYINPLMKKFLNNIFKKTRESFQILFIFCLSTYYVIDSIVSCITYFI